MSVSNPNDSPLLARVERLEELLQANPLRNAAVERGMTEYYDQSILRITDSNLEVTGTAEVFGILRVVGTAIVEGLGRLVVNSLIDLLGSMRVRGGGSITVEDGGNVVVDGGMIKAGNVETRDGKIYVGTGASQIVIDGATGKILAGDVEIELDQITVGGGDSPATLKDGALGFETGGKVEADTTNNGIRMTVGGAQVYVGTGGAALQFGTRTLIITAGGFNFLNLDTIPQSLTVDENPINSMYVDATTGRPYRVVAG
ncbi:hypothetical protein [Microbacterium sp.]|uniref:hypothetical protein n=1 Tax=Microbacterium sp. TaxID=51671 RepID=UPI0037CACD72